MKSTMCKMFWKPYSRLQEGRAKENTLLSSSDVSQKFVICCIFLESH